MNKNIYISWIFAIRISFDGERVMIFQKFVGVWNLAGLIVSIAHSQYTDDADYDDIESYEDLSFNDKLNDNSYNSINHNDFYISKELIKSEESVIMPQHKLNSYETVAKVYRYTKHRIPGYDYNEFDFNDDKNVPPRCDDKSIWTHCLCQFTCNEPDTVDCYTPCNSGCECKENYVFHEDMNHCVNPEHCYINDNNDIS